ncbi:ZYBA0S11-03774g1_1 [Zygosaccharomyces bailii CLIB 213]|uniref:FK506-binding protein n=1 Tax=Zygosaccharomyces bailii (strain CLIB 213 / ATCC 58445 / CBS 680 / BCRC 21525 / NBRC 1098 / NCYC 1416 / NRRL Y-2227) TaxID=1333698 RepID=A0A8J2TCU7_ZYGB2|nr:ZYBA0S11-03774g1_1 [Zygosaccharomyces bailii CLIB 213]
MSDMLPIATYNLNVEPYSPTPAIDVTKPVTVRLTMASLNPEAYDDDKTPATLRIIKRNPEYAGYDDLVGDSDEDDEESGSDEEEEEEEEEEIKQKEQSKKGKKGKENAKGKKEESESESEDAEDDESMDDEDDDDDEFEEYVLVTLSPQTQYQQTLDITIAPEEEVQFVVTGSYAVTVSGNYVKHPFDAPFISDDDEEDDDEDSEEYDLTPDEDEVIIDELDDLEDASDVEGRIEELIDQENKEKNKKRKQIEAETVEPKKAKKEKKDSNKEPKKESKKEDTQEPKKDKKEKKVEFKKDLEEGPTKKPKTKTLEGGVVVEDRTVGKGAHAKKGSRVGMRYIGKLKNGKVFDKNTSGKPFVFKLGVGEVIKGWDVGVAGMAVGGERRIIIPAAYAYGKQALPGIPANSELTFDVKLVSLK